MKHRYEKMLNVHYKSNALAFRASWQNPINKTTKIVITIYGRVQKVNVA